MEALVARDPERARRLAGRARAQIPVLSEGFPGDPRTGALAPEEELEDEAAAEAFFSRHAALPCPALAPETGRCEVYEHRPIPCRTFGPPVRIGDADLPPCRLCFVGSSPDEVEACRAEPDPDGLEDRLLGRFGDAPDTLVAFVLAE
jgi:Fe-S-cluster containining protein